jgi:hypothetical protein
VTLIIDAAPLVALADRRDPLQTAVREVLVTEPGNLVIPAPVTCGCEVTIQPIMPARVGRDQRVVLIAVPSAA